MRRATLQVVAAGMICLTVLAGGPAGAGAAGEVDTGFGTGGFTVTGFGVRQESGLNPGATRVLADGSILTLLWSRERSWLARYKPDGSRDTSFGNDGKVMMGKIDGKLAYTSRMAIQGSYAIVVRGGRRDRDGTIYLQRYAPSGGLSGSFGDEGVVTVKLNTAKPDGSGWFYDIGLHVDSSGRIYLAGYTPSRVQVLRFLADGTLDGSFGDGGKVTVTSGQNTEPRASLMTDDGIYIPSYESIWRVTPAGVIDPSFTRQGMPQDEGIIKMLAGPDDRIYLVTGKGIRKLNADGSFDHSFGNGGLIALNDNSLRLDQVMIDQAGRFVLSGSADDPIRPYDQDSRLMRILPNGQPDPAFGDGGEMIHDFSPGQNDSFNLTQNDSGNGILATGAWYVPASDSHPAFLARLDENGGFIPGFGSGGTLNMEIEAPTRDSMLDLAALPSGGFVAAGTSEDRAAFARYLPNGRIDPSFGNNGTATIRPGSTATGDKAVFVTGTPAGGAISCVETNPGVRLAALDANGVLDAGFGVGGYLRLPGFTLCAGLARVPGGYLVAGTRAGAPTITKLDPSGVIQTRYGKNGVASRPLLNGRHRFAFATGRDGSAFIAGADGLFKFRPDGSRAPNFGHRGFLKFDGRRKRPAAFRPASLAIGDDGSVLIVMRNNHRILIYKRLARGGQDRAFGFGGGLTIFSETGGYQVTDAAIDQAGRLVMSATVRVDCRAGDCRTGYSAIRLNRKGRLDRTFAGDGGVSGWIDEGSVSAAVVPTSSGVVLGSTSDTVSGLGDFSIIAFRR